MKSSRGFSLVELMTVVAIFGVLSAIAVPRISSASRRANAPAQIARVQAFFAEARNLARRTNRCVEVKRDDSATLTASTFSTCAATDFCPCRASALADETKTLHLDVGFPADVRVDALSGNAAGVFSVGSHISTDTIVFLADGSTPYAAPAQIPVLVPDDERGLQTTTLRVMPSTGIVRKPVAGE